VFTIQLPPLRERIEDLTELIRHFLQQFNRELSKDIHSVPPETMALLQRYPWPGNVRELQSILKQAMLVASGPVLAPAFLPTTLQSGQPLRLHEPASLETEKQILERIKAGSHDLYAEALASMERQLLTTVLRHTQGNQVQAAKILGITRGSLRTKIRALGINIERGVWSDSDQGD
jgi:two-component system nitrogen regulation response regulator GlnG